MSENQCPDIPCPDFEPMNFGDVVNFDQNLWGEILQARLAAHKKHGLQSIENIPASDPRWLPILVEEVGEIARAMTYDGASDRLRAEAIDAIAVLTAWVDSHDGMRRIDAI